MLDVLKVRRLRESRVVVVEILHPFVEVGIVVSNGSDIALEVLMVNWVESNDSGKKSNVRLGQFPANQVLFALEHLLESIQRLEQRSDRRLVCSRLRSEPRSICESTRSSISFPLVVMMNRLTHTVIDGIVDPLVRSVDLSLEISGVEVDLREFGGEEGVEARVEHSDDVGRLVGDDRLVLLVPKDRNGESVIVTNYQPML